MNDLPLDFFHLHLDSSQYFMSDEHSFRGPCIQCGGSRRMVTFINGKFPQWWVECSLCGMRGWVWQLFNLPNVIDGEWEVESIEGRVDRLNRTTEIMGRFVHEREWEQHHANMDAAAKAWWSENGVPEAWQSFWQVGYKPLHRFIHRGELYERAAYTIPKFDLGFTPVNMDYRLIDPPMGMGKYRPIYGLMSRSFIARPDLDNLTTDGRLVVVEGAKKAMVLACRLGVQVVGIPGSRTWLDLMPLIQAHKPHQVIVVLDPDAWKTSWALTRSIGPSAIQLSIPAKPDDAFLRGWLDEDSFWKFVKLSGRRL